MIWYVALGGAIGSAMRLLLSSLIQQRSGLGFPLGTLTINVTGSLLLGFLLRYGVATPAISPEVRGMLTVGFCGGYTTFSTFSYEIAALLEDGAHGRAMTYILASVTLSLAATFMGFGMARVMLDWRRVL
ncbi:MAG TPA: fluoride efflux transporter CrcB [Gemmatimonadales bacterium]|jgi:CrcB protein